MMKPDFEVLYKVFNEMESLLTKDKSVNYKEGVIDARGIILNKMQEINRRK